jgi:hypothetical protein
MARLQTPHFECDEWDRSFGGCLALGAIGIINCGMSQAMATSYINVPSSMAACQMTN